MCRVVVEVNKQILTQADIHSLRPRGKVDKMVKFIVNISHIKFDIKLTDDYCL